jgi:hypothetical protein
MRVRHLWMGPWEPAPGAWMSVACGIIFCVGPLLPYDRSRTGTVDELSTLVWPTPFFLIGLGVLVLAGGLVAVGARNAALRQFAVGFAVVPAITAATAHAVQLVRLHYGAGMGLRLSAMSVGSWALVAGCVGTIAIVLYGIGSDRVDAGRGGYPSSPAAPWVLVTAIAVCGGILLEWLVAPLAVSPDGFVPYGASAPVSDVYGALAYISTGAIPPQAVAGFGLAVLIGVAVLACGSTGFRPSGVVAGVAGAAAVDAAARLFEYAHPASAVSIRVLPWIAAALTAAVAAAVSRLIVTGGARVPRSAEAM